MEFSNHRIIVLALTLLCFAERSAGVLLKKPHVSQREVRLEPKPRAVSRDGQDMSGDQAAHAVEEQHWDAEEALKEADEATKEAEQPLTDTVEADEPVPDAREVEQSGQVSMQAQESGQEQLYTEKAYSGDKCTDSEEVDFYSFTKVSDDPVSKCFAEHSKGFSFKVSCISGSALWHYEEFGTDDCTGDVVDRYDANPDYFTTQSCVLQEVEHWKWSPPIQMQCHGKVTYTETAYSSNLCSNTTQVHQYKFTQASGDSFSQCFAELSQGWSFMISCIAGGPQVNYQEYRTNDCSGGASAISDEYNTSLAYFSDQSCKMKNVDHWRWSPPLHMCQVPAHVSNAAPVQFGLSGARRVNLSSQATTKDTPPTTCGEYTCKTENWNKKVGIDDLIDPSEAKCCEPPIDTKCQVSMYACCTDGITERKDEMGTNCLFRGGCAITEQGCCGDGYTKRVDYMSCNVDVCSNISGGFSDTYPCKCGVSIRSPIKCEEGKYAVCSATNDINGQCAECSSAAPCPTGKTCDNGVCKTVVCSNVAGGDSDIYPCRCGISLATQRVCRLGQFCTASTDTDGECTTPVHICSNKTGGESSDYPCKCGLTANAATECSAGLLCSATDDLDGECKKPDGAYPLGCYKPEFNVLFTPEHPVYKTVLRSRGYMSINKCRLHCKSLQTTKYFQITNGDTCYCTHAPMGHKMPDSMCKEECSGNEKQECGGKGNEASVWVMYSCVEPNLDPAQELARLASLVRESYWSIAGETCAHEESNGNTAQVTIQGGVTQPTPEQCMQACTFGQGAKTCHGFTYQANLKRCLFVIDVLSGERTFANESTCYIKKISQPIVLMSHLPSLVRANQSVASKIHSGSHQLTLLEKISNFVADNRVWKWLESWRGHHSTQTSLLM